ncbi:dihydropyrimidinase [Gulosibacter sp. ACHW.36C]|uniref:Dihydropyrimidinase n=1 Tax=Gulosibacter sediminis TaxID=1729695 RepID=A0ABY4MW54_9MICO|nr:dihydropyrimidinase [Gulosibacter sediminis]UQN14657.1 dihydropyrimidinase [Gulosibacter sediminis]
MKQTSFVLHGGTVALPGGESVADIVVRDGRIDTITSSGAAEHLGLPVVNVAGKVVMPGGVDVHTHMDAPSGIGHTTDTHRTGTIAAAVGGTTTIVDYAPQPKEGTLLDAYGTWSDKAAGEAVIDYSFHVTASHLYEGFASDLATLVTEGIPSFKVFMAYKGDVMLDDGELFDVLRNAGRKGAQINIHAENGDVIDRIAADLVREGMTAPKYHELARPAQTEVEAVRRAIAIAEMAEAPAYFVHLSTEGAVEEVAAARQRGLPISAETCTHYLTLNRSVYDAPGFDAAKYVLTPPLREQEHVEGLWRGLKTGAVGIVSSDHCPLCMHGQKSLGRDDFRKIPNGGPGVEHRLMVLYDAAVAQGKLGLTRFVEVAAAEPARSAGLYPRKGVIAVGSDADLVIIDPNGTTTVSADTQYQHVDYALWEGWTLNGAINQVYSRGVLVAEDGKFVGPEGHGEFVRRFKN